jgi:hypothetical protein
VFILISQGLNIRALAHHLSTQKKQVRAGWRERKKKSATLCKQFLNEKAELLASKMRTSEENALWVIILLTQVDVNFNPLDNSSPHIPSKPYPTLCKQFLNEKAELLASKMRTSDKRALWASYR